MKPAATRRGAPPRPPADARALAWEILRRVEEDSSYADALLGHQLSGSGLPLRDQALVTRLVYGTIAWQGYLDHIIAAFSRRPPQALDAPVRVLLRMALFQMCLLTRVPDFAAVNTAVQLAKGFRGGAAAGLVNAVLRRATAEWQQVPVPSAADDPAGCLATRFSHPRWLVERWLARYGFGDTEALLRADNEPAPTVLRVNRCKIDREHLLARLRDAGVSAEATTYSPAGIRVEHAGPPERIAGYADGLFSLQGEASQLVSRLVAPRSGDRVLDVCAAPGGKTTHLAELMENQGEIIALDIHAAGIDRVAHMGQRLGLSIIQPMAADALTWRPASDGFDCVLVDAPCSGLGTLRQHPEVRWRRSPADIADLARLQTQLLGRVAEYVRLGGTLLYATCTLSAEENDDVLAAFLHDRRDFSLDDPRSLLPEAARPLVDGGVLRTFPHHHGLDGFFAARLKRRETRGIVTA